MMSRFRLIFIVAIPFLLLQSTYARPEHKLRKKDVPRAVLTAFEKAYPNATAKGYSKEMENGKTEYEIQSREGAVSRDVSYDESGTVISVEETLSATELPEPVHAAFMKDYPKGKILKCEKVTENGVTNFEILVKSGKRKSEIVYTADGATVTTEKK